MTIVILILFVRFPFAICSFRGELKEAPLVPAASVSFITLDTGSLSLPPSHSCCHRRAYLFQCVCWFVLYPDKLTIFSLFLVKPFLLTLALDCNSGFGVYVLFYAFTFMGNIYFLSFHVNTLEKTTAAKLRLYNS